MIPHGWHIALAVAPHYLVGVLLLLFHLIGTRFLARLLVPLQKGLPLSLLAFASYDHLILGGGAACVLPTVYFGLPLWLVRCLGFVKLYSDCLSL